MFKSKAQIAKFSELVKEGKMSQAEFDKRMSHTPDPESLPERVRQVSSKVGFVKKIRRIR